MSGALQLFGFLMGLVGSLISGVTISAEKWKTSTSAGNVITTSYSYENLWKSCMTDSTGLSACKNFVSLLEQTAFIQACRALMIISLILGLFACILSLFGLKCTKFGSSDEYAKGKIALSGGLIFILAGICCLVPVSWYAASITQQFFDTRYSGQRYELGSALYIGWAGSLLAILGGSLLCCSFKKKKKSAKKGATAYIYNKQPDSEFTQFKEMRESAANSRAYV
ncbi:claudin-10-like isoform X2 [Dendropsophus ebraccatus]|uniref:claudin-10-like isoform X2 n=1 Tax=Dendropsophus ebraccatus TaxID=150705 RepID=UPI003831B3C4